MLLAGGSLVVALALALLISVLPSELVLTGGPASTCLTLSLVIGATASDLPISDPIWSVSAVQEKEQGASILLIKVKPIKS